MIDLYDFTSTREELDARFLHPWNSGEYTYASDGRIMIRVPRVLDYEGEAAEIPSASKALDLIHGRVIEWIATPEIDNRYQITSTLNRAGDMVETREYVNQVWPESVVAHKYARLIRALPNSQIGLTGKWNGKNGQAFRADHGVLGAAMPVMLVGGPELTGLRCGNSPVFGPCLASESKEERG